MQQPVRLKVENTREVEQQKLAIPGWTQEYTQMSSGVFRGRTVHAQLGEIEVFEEQMNLRVEQEFHAPKNTLVFSFDMTDDTLYLLNGQTYNAWVTPNNYRELSVVINDSALALDSEGLGIDDLILTPLKSQYCRLFSRWLSKILTDATKDPFQIGQQHLGRQLLEDCCFVLEQGLEVEQREAQTVQVREAIQHVIERLRDRPHDSLNMLEMAHIAGVSVKQLQQLFKQHAGISPTHWLRNRRLNAARRDLIQASSGKTTVAEVAMRWSFWHLGRFSGAYFALFGEHPRATLAKTP